ncbi:hypothetical protein, partial [Paraburkholderia bryophila]|uniref:hypothetical protein n=1 Tax=Paraburkholderia bryophila TaxID=420952 RepID=UPI001ABFBA10
MYEGNYTVTTYYGTFQLGSLKTRFNSQVTVSCEAGTIGWIALAGLGRSEANAGDQRRTETIEIGLRLPSVGVELISWHVISFQAISILPTPPLKGQSNHAKEDYRDRANRDSTTSGSLRIHPSTRAGRQPRRAATGQIRQPK